MGWGLEFGDAELAQRTAAALAWFWMVRRHVTEAGEWFDRVLAANGGSQRARASALIHAGLILSMERQDDLGGCLARIQEGQTHFRELGDETGMAMAQTYEAVILWYQRDLDASGRALVKMEAVWRTFGFDWGAAFCSWWQGSASQLAGDSVLAYANYHRGLEIFRRVGDLTLIAWTLLPLGNMALEADDLDLASTLYDESLAMMSDIGDRHGAGAVLIGLGTLAHFRGETAEAQRLLEEAQTHLREGGGGQGLSWPISNVPVDTRTHALLVEATDRYQKGLDLPPEEWARMVRSDGEAWRARQSQPVTCSEYRRPPKSSP